LKYSPKFKLILFFLYGKGFGDQPPVAVFQEDFHLLLGLIQLSRTKTGQAYSLLKSFERFFQAEVSILQFLDDGLQFAKGIFEFLFRHFASKNTVSGTRLQVASIRFQIFEL
jgi:hypothetical protein